jgi:hypothetical protein
MCAGAEGIFKAAVKTFKHAISLGVIGCGRLVVNIEEGAERFPK